MTIDQLGRTEQRLKDVGAALVECMAIRGELEARLARAVEALERAERFRVKNLPLWECHVCERDTGPYGRPDGPIDHAPDCPFSKLQEVK